MCGACACVCLRGVGDLEGVHTEAALRTVVSYSYRARSLVSEAFVPCKVGGSSSQSHPNQSLVSEKRGVYTFVHSSRRVYRKEGPVASIKRESRSGS